MDAVEIIFGRKTIVTLLIHGIISYSDLINRMSCSYLQNFAPETVKKLDMAELSILGLSDTDARF